MPEGAPTHFVAVEVLRRLASLGCSEEGLPAYARRGELARLDDAERHLSLLRRRKARKQVRAQTQRERTVRPRASSGAKGTA